MKKQLMNARRIAILGGVAISLSACMGSGQQATPSVVQPPDQRAYVHEMNQGQRQAALAQFDAQMQAELEYLVALYQRGRPVSFGGITATFQPLLGLVEVNFDHTLQGAPTVHSGKMVFPADRHGRLVGTTDKDGNTVPRALFANATQGMTGEALLMQGIFGVLGSAMQGSVGAMIGGGGGGINVIAQAGSQSSSDVDVDVNAQQSTGGCPPQGCAPSM